MTTPAILDADVATLARWARTGFDWWIDELRGLVPPGLKRHLAPQPAVIALADGDRIGLLRHGLPVDRAAGPVVVALPAEAVLLRVVRLPALGQADLRRLVLLDADRLLPFPAGAAFIDFDSGPRGADGLAQVTIAGAPVGRARQALAAAEAAGLAVTRLGVATGDGVRFDFLPALHAADGTAPGRARRWWWSLVAAAFVLNLAVLIGRDVYALRETEALVTAHGEAAATARTLRARVLGEDARRRALLARRDAQDPLPLLAAATRALPDTAWVQRLSWDGGQLRLAGYKTGAADVVAALRRFPAFASARRVPGEATAASSTTEPFDVSIERPGQRAEGIQ